MSLCRRLLANPDHALRPGMFAKVEVILPEKHEGAGRSRLGDFLRALWRFGFCDREEERSERRARNLRSFGNNLCAVGEARGDFVAVTEGLKAGETIVSTGVFKLRNGMAVTINNDARAQAAAKSDAGRHLTEER